MADGSGRRFWLADRTTGDLLLLLIASTVCASVLAAGAAISIIAILHPEVDLTSAVGMVSSVINTLIGLLAGFLAGRTDAHLTIARGRVDLDTGGGDEREADRPADE